MKKLLALLLAALMLLAVLPASAEEDDVTLKDCGITFAYPDALDQSEYTSGLVPYGIVNRDPILAFFQVSYCPIARSEYAELAQLANNGDNDALNEIQSQATVLAVVAATDAETLDDALEPLGGLAEGETVTELGETDGYRFYLILEDTAEYLAALEALGKSEAETQKVRSDIDGILTPLLESLQSAELYRPYDPSEAVIGQSLCFESTDLDGNTVNTADLFKANRITMVNLWGTWCPSCVDEMEELAEIHTRLQEKGCGIVGIEWEKKPIEAFKDDALALLAEKGTNYPCVLYPEDFPALDPFNSFPTTLFVDSEGKVLTYPITGARVDEYEKTVDALLADDAPEAAPESAPITGEAGAYRVIVSDGEGPVKGVTVQFCDDETCTFQKTNENGVATFTPAAEKVYEVHILKVPEGYAEHEGVYNTADTWSDVNITIEKAK